MARFDMKVDPLWSIPLLIIGATKSRSYAEVGDAEVFLKFGIGEERIQLAEIASVEAHRWSIIYGIGHRIGYGGLAFVGSTQGVIRIELKEPRLFNVLFGLKLRFRRFFVSIEDQQGFIAAVSERLTVGDDAGR